MKKRSSIGIKQLKRKEIVKSLLTKGTLPSHFIGDISLLIMSWLRGLGIPILTVSIALIFKLELSAIIGENILFLLFFVPIVVSTLLAGFYSGVIATLLGAGGAAYFLLPAFILDVFPYREVITLIIYTFEGLLISYIIELQRRAQVSLSEIEERFRLLFANTGDYAILFLNPYGDIVRWNIGAQKLFGYKENEILGNHFSVLFPHEAREKRQPEKEYRTALTKNRASDENYLMKKDQTQFWASGFTSALWDNEGNIRGFVKIIRDTTQMHTMEQQKEDFISVASHELKTPVASMQIYTQLLQKYYTNNPPKEKEPKTYLSRISSQLKNLNELMGTLLDISRIQQGKITLQKEHVNITQLVDETIENIQATEKQHKIVRKGSIRKIVFLDKRRIAEILTNLLTNAIKYSPYAEKVIVKLERKGNSLHIYVIDFGIGIPNSKLEKIFERFYRTEAGVSYAQGMGLGLYISSQIAKAHGGALHVRSKPGKGSTFSLILPT